MQVKKEQLERQQEILKVLGFYHGKIDGIWGPKSIEAKKKFEGSASFSPGIPKNGLPFADFGPYPANVTMDHATGLLHHPRVAELAKQEVAPAPAPVVETPVEVKPAQPQNPQQHNQGKK